jgi:hypothetical protein
VSEDACDGVAATVVVAEGLREEAPDGGHGAEDSVAEQDAVPVERVEDAVLAQGSGEGQALIAREAVADLLEGRHGVALKSLGCAGGAGRARRRGEVQGAVKRPHSAARAGSPGNFILRPLRLCWRHSSHRPRHPRGSVAAQCPPARLSPSARERSPGGRCRRSAPSAPGRRSPAPRRGCRSGRGPRAAAGPSPRAPVRRASRSAPSRRWPFTASTAAAPGRCRATAPRPARACGRSPARSTLPPAATRRPPGPRAATAPSATRSPGHSGYSGQEGQVTERRSGARCVFGMCADAQRASGPIALCRFGTGPARAALRGQYVNTMTRSFDPAGGPG